ncbi:MAG: hypothetical protein J6J42_12065 [Lachnospiraceae bacterium]|nr:hypothetical protein [Lachnospiraceae bacterium]
MVNSFKEFCEELIKSGFSMGGGNAKGIYAVVPYDWKTTIPSCPVVWHTGDPETDPWEWRMRVLEERKDIAYGKVFFGSSGYITKEWYPYFLAVRRQGMTFEEWYETGTISYMEKLVYDVIAENKKIALHDIKRDCGITKETSSQFDKALTSLQKNLFVTMCGRMPKFNKNGEPYGWNSTVFCTVEEFWGEEMFMEISKEEAYQRIHDQILKLNPDAEEKVIKKFIL